MSSKKVGYHLKRTMAFPLLLQDGGNTGFDKARWHDHFNFARGNWGGRMNNHPASLCGRDDPHAPLSDEAIRYQVERH